MHMDRSSGSAAAEAQPPTQGPLAGIDAGPVLDPEAIERLRELDPNGTQGVLQRVLRAYESSLSRHLVDIGSARHDGDLDRLARAVHTLKSSSAAVGALAFSQRCADVEHGVRTVRRLPGAAEIDALMADGQRVLAAVGAMLST